jgi:hypothetical protein
MLSGVTMVGPAAAVAAAVDVASAVTSARQALKFIMISPFGEGNARDTRRPSEGAARRSKGVT